MPGLREHFDRPVRRRLTDVGATDVSPVKRRIANTEHGDGWKKGWMSGGKRSLKKKRLKKRDLMRNRGGERVVGGGIRGGLLENDKGKWRQEGREVKDVG